MVASNATIVVSNRRKVVRTIGVPPIAVTVMFVKACDSVKLVEMVLNNTSSNKSARTNNSSLVVVVNLLSPNASDDELKKENSPKVIIVVAGNDVGAKVNPVG
mmetsp:Transcript_20396/g.44011  ORF Transcript_20396/g.44011 Transcript_20396/m.44011 type:complete len:103 (+) Transcript_20396:579-887(+)